VLSDKSLEALKNAQNNANQNNVRVSTLQSDIYDGLSDQKFDLITVHPPAVPYPKGQDWGMTTGMRVATDGGNDGSHFVERSITEAKRHLRSKGSLLLLLPHWSNVTKAMKTLRSHYKEIKILGSKAVDFFPMIEGRPTRALIEHIKQLAAKGIIEMEFPENAPPQSSVTIIKANKMIL
jgi:methylase of polypeptide subunit release factors